MLTLLAIVGLLILPAMQLIPAPAQQVSASVQQWEKTTGIDVSDFSADRLLVEIPLIAKQLQISAAPPTDMTPDEYRTFVLGALTEQYLYWSRDRAGAGVTRLGEPTVAPEAVRAFIAALQPTVQGRQTGKMAVSSVPLRGTIDIDGQDKGFTQNVYVLSVGRHAVIVTPPGKIACRQSVTIVAGKTATVDCK